MTVNSANVMKRKIVLFFLLFISNFDAFAEPLSELKEEKSNSHSCVVKFELDNWNSYIPKLKNCFRLLDAKQEIAFTINTNPLTRSEFNKNLWKKRLENLANELNTLFPGTKIKANSWGKKRYLPNVAVVVANIQAKQETKKEDSNKTPTPLSQSAISTTSPLQLSVSSQAPVQISVSSAQAVQIVQDKSSSCPIYKTAEKNNKPEKNKIIEVKNSKPFETKIWGGLSFVYVVGDFSSYVSPFYMGYTVGLAQNLYSLNQENEFYVSMTADYANNSQTMTVNSQRIKSIFYMMNVDFLGGIEHFFSRETHSFSIYGDIGPVLAQRAFLVATPGGSTNNYDISLQVNLAANIGMNYVYKLTDGFGVLLKTNIETVGGMPRNQPVYSATGEVLDTVNDNPIMFVPSVSLGVRF